ncbi:MAG: hypothetical protein V4611_04125 [Patescibacteria group bacterium]
MGTHRLAGFTIIETMLFLAISGLLIVALIAGTGASLNIQRYRDATESFKSVLQQQYADIISVQNDRDNTWSCGGTAIPDSDAVTPQDRGQSDCMLIGKYVRVDSNEISIYRIIGYGSSSAGGADDIAALKSDYLLNVSGVDEPEVDESELEWGTKIAWPAITETGAVHPAAGTPRTLGVLVLRSPSSGQIYTFTSNDIPAKDAIGSLTFANMIVAGNAVPGQGAQLICIDSDGLYDGGDRAIYLSGYASGTSAVELRTNDYMQEQGILSRC